MRSLLYAPFGALAVLFAVLLVYREELGFRFILVVTALWIGSIFLVAGASSVSLESLFDGSRLPARAALTIIEAILAIASLIIAKVKGGYHG